LTCGNNDLHAASRGSGGRSAQHAGRPTHGPSGGASPRIETVKKREVKSSRPGGRPSGRGDDSESHRRTSLKMQYKAATAVLAGVMGTGAATVPAALADPGQAGPARASATAQPANAYPKGRVTSRTRLAIRSRPTTFSRRLGSLHPGQIVDIKCWARGQSVRGVRTWYRLGISTPEWVSGRYIRIIKGRVHHC
jgi:hypothetical protein